MRFTSTPGEFFRKNEAFKDMVMGHMAQDIEVALKSSSGMPVKTGNMKSQTRHFKSATSQYRVEVDVEYAAYQERGSRADGSRVVRHYTTGGTSKGFFKRAINNVLSHRDSYLEEARRAVGL